MVSFPVLASFIFVKYPRVFSTGAMFFNSFIFAIPSFLMFGIARWSTDSAMCPSVSVPASPYAAASFAPPTPNESITIVKIRLYFFGFISFPPSQLQLSDDAICFYLPVSVFEAQQLQSGSQPLYHVRSDSPYQVHFSPDCP